MRYDGKKNVRIDGRPRIAYKLSMQGELHESLRHEDTTREQSKRDV